MTRRYAERSAQRAPKNVKRSYRHFKKRFIAPPFTGPAELLLATVADYRACMPPVVGTPREQFEEGLTIEKWYERHGCHRPTRNP